MSEEFIDKCIKNHGKFLFSNNVQLIKELKDNKKYQLVINRAGTGGLVTIA